LLCEPKYKIGLIASFYFIGVIATMTFIPYVAHTYGRKLVFCISVAVQASILLAMILSDNIYELYAWEFLMGATFVGRVIIGLTYVVEY